MICHEIYYSRQEIEIIVVDRQVRLVRVIYENTGVSTVVCQYGVVADNKVRRVQRTRILNQERNVVSSKANIVVVHRRSDIRDSRSKVDLSRPPHVNSRDVVDEIIGKQSNIIVGYGDLIIVELEHQRNWQLIDW